MTQILTLDIAQWEEIIQILSLNGARGYLQHDISVPALFRELDTNRHITTRDSSKWIDSFERFVQIYSPTSWLLHSVDTFSGREKSRKIRLYQISITNKLARSSAITPVRRGQHPKTNALFHH